MRSARGPLLACSRLLPLLAVAVAVVTTGCPKPSTDETGAAASAVATTTTTHADASVSPTSVAPAGKAARRKKPRPPRPPVHLNPGPEALGRKARSEARLTAEGVATNGALPVIDSAAEATLRSPEAVVDRALALLVVARKGDGAPPPEVLGLRDKLGATALLTPDETDFVDDERPTAKDLAQFRSRYEGLAVMLWALGDGTELPRPAAMVDAAALAKRVTDKGAPALRAAAHLRSAKEILDAADLAYRYDWACVAARMTAEEPPKGVDCDVVLERHRALNWLVGYQSQAWDDVSTDT